MIIEQIFDKSQTNTPKKIVKNGEVTGSHAAAYLLKQSCAPFAFACELLATKLKRFKCLSQLVIQFETLDCQSN